MAVIVYQKQHIDGATRVVGQFLPMSKALDEHMVQQAKVLDKELQKKIGVINEQFKTLKQSAVKSGSTTAKWIWLGRTTGKLIRSLKHLKEEDIYNNAIWPAINQYLCADLQKANNPSMGGGVNDHLRKCYYFVKYDFHKTLPNWGAWSELSDRGDQLIHSPAFRESFGETFGRDKKKLTNQDYKSIAKMLAEQWPSNIQERIILDHVKSDKIKKDMHAIYERWQRSGRQDKN